MQTEQFLDGRPSAGTKTFTTNDQILLNNLEIFRSCTPLENQTFFKLDPPWKSLSIQMEKPIETQSIGSKVVAEIILLTIKTWKIFNF